MILLSRVTIFVPAEAQEIYEFNHMVMFRFDRRPERAPSRSSVTWPSWGPAQQPWAYL